MAVMTARSIARRLVNIQHLDSLLKQSVNEMRRDAIKITVNALWRRYRDHQKREEPRSFIDWLVWKEHFEATYLSHGDAWMLSTRRGWAFSYLKFLERKELMLLAEDPDSLWYFEALEAAINAKQYNRDWVIVVETVPRDGMPYYELKPGYAISFTKDEKPVELEPADLE